MEKPNMRPIGQLLKLKVTELTPEEHQRRLEYKRKYKQSDGYFKQYYEAHKDVQLERNRLSRGTIQGRPRGRPRTRCTCSTCGRPWPTTTDESDESVDSYDSITSDSS